MKTPLPRTNNNTKICLIAIVVVFFLYKYHVLLTSNDTELLENEIDSFNDYRQTFKYLINTSICQLPDIDPFSGDFAKYFHKIDYIPCSKLELLTYIEKRNGLVMLRVNASLLQAYSTFNITCCYSKIIRNYKMKSDSIITYSPCITFKEYVIISHPYIRVNCSDGNSSEVYRNVHATTIPTKEQTQRLDNTKVVFSVLLVGIGSTSKLNLVHTMPKTYEHLEKHFVNLKGYNTVGANTFTNLMSILTGQNRIQVDKRCGWYNNFKLNKCGVIWDSFKNMGYVTAYVEDTCIIGINERGFIKPPTDYYYRPYTLAAAELPRKYIESMSYCYGPETPDERIFNIVKDFSTNFKYVPKFGLAWISSFSFKDMSIASAMDETVLKFLNDSNFNASLKNTFVVFFSDYGFKANDIRFTYPLWLQERMPIMYVHIPDSFKRHFPEKYDTFLINTRRLTTPYDIHNTLQEILELSNDAYVAKRSVACPKCRSLFEEIDEARSCEDAAINPQWCTCTRHTNINPKDKLVQSVAEFIVNKINSILRYFPEGHKCVEYNVKRVISTNMSEVYDNATIDTVCYFFITIETEPSSVFDATVEALLTSHTYHYEVLGDISRLNKYRKHAFCVKDVVLKKYCYCN